MVHLKQVFLHFPGCILKDHESPDSSWSRFQPTIIVGMCRIISCIIKIILILLTVHY